MCFYRPGSVYSAVPEPGLQGAWGGQRRASPPGETRRRYPRAVPPACFPRFPRTHATQPRRTLRKPAPNPKGTEPPCHPWSPAILPYPPSHRRAALPLYPSHRSLGLSGRRAIFIPSRALPSLPAPYRTPCLFQTPPHCRISPRPRFSARGYLDAELRTSARNSLTMQASGPSRPMQRRSPGAEPGPPPNIPLRSISPAPGMQQPRAGRVAVRAQEGQM